MADNVRPQSLAAEIAESVACELAGAQFAMLFGSVGAAHFREESDVDVAVQFAQALAPMRRLELAAALERAVARSVDLVDLRAADPVLAFQVLSSSHPAFINDAKAYHQFAMRTLSEYMDLKLDRRPVEQALAQRGLR